VPDRRSGSPHLEPPTGGRGWLEALCAGYASKTVTVHVRADLPPHDRAGRERAVTRLTTPTCSPISVDESRQQLHSEANPEPAEGRRRGGSNGLRAHGYAARTAPHGTGPPSWTWQALTVASAG
jgi:hypothetical protein